MEADLVQVSCPSCDQTLRVPVDYLGQKVRCNHCEAAFVSRVSASEPVSLPGGPFAPGPALAAENVRLWTELEARSNEIREARARIRELDEKARRRKERIASLQLSVSKFTNQKRKLDEARAERDQLVETVASLREEAEAANQDRDQAIAAQAREIEVRRAEFDAEIQLVTTRLGTAEAAAEALRAEVEDQRILAVRAEDARLVDLDRFRQSAEVTRLDLEKLREALDAAEIQAEGRRDEVEDLHREIRRSKDLLLAEISGRREAIEAGRRDRDRLREDLAEAETEVEELKREVQELRGHLDQGKDAWLVEINAEKAAAEEARLERDRIRENLVAVETERARIAASRDELEKSARATEDRLRSEAEALRMQLEEMDRLMADSSIRLEVSQRSVLELNEALDSSARDFDDRLGTIREEIEATRADLDHRLTESEATSADLERRLIESEAIRAGIDRRLTESETERSRAVARVGFLDAALKAGGPFLSPRVDEADEVENARRQVEALKIELAEARAEAGRVQSTLFDLGVRFYA